MGTEDPLQVWANAAEAQVRKDQKEAQAKQNAIFAQTVLSHLVLNGLQINMFAYNGSNRLDLVPRINTDSNSQERTVDWIKRSQQQNPNARTYDFVEQVVRFGGHRNAKLILPSGEKIRVFIQTSDTESFKLSTPIQNIMKRLESE